MLSNHALDWTAEKIDEMPSLTAQTLAATTVLVPLIGLTIAKDYIRDLPWTVATKTQAYADSQRLQADRDSPSLLRRTKAVTAVVAYAFGVGGPEDAQNGQDEINVGEVGWSNVLDVAGRTAYAVGSRILQPAGELAVKGLQHIQQPPHIEEF